MGDPMLSVKVCLWWVYLVGLSKEVRCLKLESHQLRFFTSLFHIIPISD